MSARLQSCITAEILHLAELSGAISRRMNAEIDRSDSAAKVRPLAYLTRLG